MTRIISALALLLLLTATLPAAAPVPVPASAKDQEGNSLPRGAVARMGTARFRAGSWACTAISRDGRHLVVGHTVLNLATGLEAGRIPDELPDAGGSIGSIHILPDASSVLLEVTKWDGKVSRRSLALWDFAAEKVTRTLPVDWQVLPEAFVNAHNLSGVGLRIVAVSPLRGNLLVADNNRELVLWVNLDTTPKPVHLGKTTGGGLYDDAGFTPDGKSVVNVGRTIRVWDAATGKLNREFPGVQDVAARWAVSPDGKRLAIISGKATPEEQAKYEALYRVSLWDFAKGTETRELTASLACRKYTIFSIQFAPDGETVVVFDYDDATHTLPVRRWQATDGKLLPKWSLPSFDGGQNATLISPNGKTLYCVTSPGVRSFDMDTGAEQSPDDLRKGSAYPIGLLADEKHFVAYRGRDAVGIWELETGRFVREEKLPAAIAKNTIWGRYSPDARFIADDRGIKLNNGPDIIVSERTTGRELYRLAGERCGTFTPDGKSLFTLSPDYKEANIRDAATGKLIRVVDCDGDSEFVFSPDGKAFSRPWRWNTQIHDMNSGEMLFNGKELLQEHFKPQPIRRQFGQPPGWSDRISTVGLGMEGKRFAVIGMRYWDEGEGPPPQDRVVMFDTVGKKLLWEANPETGRWFGYDGTAAVFSPNGRVLAVGGWRTILLFDTETGKQLQGFAGHLGTVGYLRFTNDGKRLISADWHGGLLVWDTSKW